MDVFRNVQVLEENFASSPVKGRVEDVDVCLSRWTRTHPFCLPACVHGCVRALRLSEASEQPVTCPLLLR